MKRCHEQEQFLSLYRAGTHTNTELARMFGVSGGTITYWARQHGLPQRRRGRRRSVRPSTSERRVLSFLEREAPVEVARRLGVSRQYVHQVRQKWLSQFEQLNCGKTSFSAAGVPRLPEVKSRIISFRVSNAEFLDIEKRTLALEVSPGEVARTLLLVFSDGQTAAENRSSSFELGALGGRA